MKIAILGSGMVGETLASKFIELGHEVMMGSRDKENAKTKEWSAKMSGKGKTGTFKEAAEFGEMVFNCTAGMHSLEALEMAGAQALAGKILVDVANPLDFSRGMPPTLSVCNTDSLGEQIQRAFPDARVVKALNTVAAPVMVNPGLIKRKPDLFMAGNEAKAKKAVKRMLKKELGWTSVIDLGDITGARGMEMTLPIWLRLWSVLDNAVFGTKIVKGEKPQS
jgi:8-hydroxy-5-deazaflavin:NADPH oxidoreductase